MEAFWLAQPGPGHPSSVSHLSETSADVVQQDKIASATDRRQFHPIIPR